MKSITQFELRNLVHYDPDSGRLTWRVSRGRVRAGDEIKSVNADGYVQIGVCGGRYLAHRAIWLYMTGKWPTNIIDHWDGDRRNNSWINLRNATSITNAQNMRSAHADNRHGLLGVSFIRGRKSRPYRSEIRYQGQQIRLGTFPTAELAHAAYLTKKRQLHEGNTL